MPSKAALAAEERRAKQDRFGAHAETAGMLFYRDVISKEMMAKEAFETNPPVDYRVDYLWKAVTGRRAETEKLSQESRHWKLPYPWTSARVDRSDVDGLNHSSGVRTYDNIRDTWYNVMHRDATALSRFHRDKADRPPSPGHMPRYLAADGECLDSMQSARVRADLKQSQQLYLTQGRVGGGYTKHNQRPRSAALSSRSALRSTRRGHGAGSSTSRSRASTAGRRKRPPTAGSSRHRGRGHSQAWDVPGAAGGIDRMPSSAKQAVLRALQEKHRQRKANRRGGLSHRSMKSSLSSNTWLSLGHTARSGRTRR